MKKKNILSPSRFEVFYHQRWRETDKRKFSKEEINAISHAIAVKTEYGYTVEFHMKSGDLKYIPFTSNSIIHEGDFINLENAYMITLSKLGETDLYRIAYNVVGD